MADRNRFRAQFTTRMLDRARVPDMNFEQADGLPILLDSDYFGIRRAAFNPAPGPLAGPEDGKQAGQGLATG